jgi:4-amino-4-deoxy-L-arabinose transferase-like glycosyltransferase
VSIAASNLPRPSLPFRWLGMLARPAEHSGACVALLLAMSLCLFFYGLDTSELWRTESLRAILAQQMLDSGDWIVPRLYGEPMFTKPPGMYIAIALCSLPLGHVTEFTARLPSALAATACVLLFFWYFKRHLGRVAGLAAGLILPLSPMWLDKASAAEIDMLQVAWVTASLLYFFRATENDEGPGPFRWWLAAALCMAGGFLTKWTAPEFFYGTAIPYLWWRGRLRWLFRWQHFVSASIAAGVALAWIGAAIGMEGWDVFWAPVQREALSRLVPTYDTYRPDYPWRESLLHPFRLLATTLPWSAAALLTLRPSFAQLLDARGRRLLVAMHCWAWPHVLFWSLPTEHTPRHSFPLFPGIAGLAALVWFAWHNGKLRWPAKKLRPVHVLVVSLVLWLVAKGLFVHAVMPHRNADRQPRAKGALLAALVPVDRILYLFRLKDEGIMFYYGRPALRLASPEHLPGGPEPRYCILTDTEWQRWPASRPAEELRRFADEQGAPLVLVRVLP